MKEVRKRRRKKGKTLAVILLVLIVAGLATVFGLFRVQKIKISGNKQYKAKTIQEAILKDGLCKNSLYLIWKFKDQEKVTEDIPFLSGASARLITPFEVEITVHEKQQIGYLLNQGSYVYFDKDGMVVDISDQVQSGVPLITGLDVEKAELYQQLPVKDAGLYNTIVTLTKTLNKNGIVPNEIRFNTSNTITLIFDKINVNLGDDTVLEDKISALQSILEQLDGKTGTIYMESYSENSGQVTLKIWNLQTMMGKMRKWKRKPRKAEEELIPNRMVLSQQMPMETRLIRMPQVSPQHSVMSTIIRTKMVM